MGADRFGQLISNLSEYSRAAVKGIAACQRVQIVGNKNQTIDVARKIVKVKRPGKFEEAH